MTEHSLWRFSRALHRAINERQFGEIEPLIDEDVEWTIHGPVDLFPFFGFMPGGAILGGLAGAITFGMLAARDREIAIERPPKPPRKP